jgi:hypothetical protein
LDDFCSDGRDGRRMQRKTGGKHTGIWHKMA